jgi:hypothetical protein
MEVEEKVINRFSGAIWSNKTANPTKTIDNYPALIVGLGATGSFLAMFLARAGVGKFQLVDFDLLENHNIFSQNYPFHEIGNYKADALSNTLTNFSNATDVHLDRYKIEDLNWLSSSIQSKKIFCATLDKMDGRKYMFEKWLKKSPDDSIFFDSRIGAEYWEVYAIPKGNIDKIERYKATLFSDTEGTTGACNYQQSSHSACGAALKIVELTTNWVTNQIIEDDYLPFKVTNDIRTNNYGVNY